jgi:hypothetical protein
MYLQCCTNKCTHMHCGLYGKGVVFQLQCTENVKIMKKGLILAITVLSTKGVNFLKMVNTSGGRA